MSYPQGYLYQAPGSLALYSCPAYGASALAAPRSEELARSASGSAFSPYPGSAAFTAQAATGFGSPLQYSADAAAAAAGFPSYMVTERGLAGGVARCRAQRPWSVIGDLRVAGNVVWEAAPKSRSWGRGAVGGDERQGGRPATAVARGSARPSPRLPRSSPREPEKCDPTGVGTGSGLGGPLSGAEAGRGVLSGPRLASSGAGSKGRRPWASGAIARRWALSRGAWGHWAGEISGASAAALGPGRAAQIFAFICPTGPCFRKTCRPACGPLSAASVPARREQPLRRGAPGRPALLLLRCPARPGGWQSVS